MNQYYLMSQLPSLDTVGESGGLPITEERFFELCSRFLGKKALKALCTLSLVPAPDAEKSGSAWIDTWHDCERKLRLALAAERAGKLKKNFESQAAFLPLQTVQTARAAVSADDPMEAERTLNRFRLERLEAMRPADGFSEDAVFYYGCKLKLLQRMQDFDENRGREKYRNIYASIMRGDGQEVQS